MSEKLSAREAAILAMAMKSPQGLSDLDIFESLYQEDGGKTTRDAVAAADALADRGLLERRSYYPYDRHPATGEFVVTREWGDRREYSLTQAGFVALVALFGDGE